MWYNVFTPILQLWTNQISYQALYQLPDVQDWRPAIGKLIQGFLSLKGRQMGTVYIYGLWDCRDGRLRYIGKTVNLKARLHRHCVDYNRGKITHCSTWVKGLLNEGLEPMMEILEECTEDNWRESERDWIAKAREFGLNLTNMVDGGNGGHTRGIPLSQETREKISKKLKGRIVTWVKPMSHETLQKMIANRHPRRGHKLTEEHKQKIGAANAIALRGRRLDDEHRELTRQAALKRWSKDKK